MTWTKTPPTGEGWYWWRLDASHAASVTHVTFQGLAGVAFRTLKVSGEWWDEPLTPPGEPIGCETAAAP
jgi:hypothetical protein